MLRILSLFVLIGGLALVAMACGNGTRDDASPALGEYFADHLAIHKDVNGRIMALKTIYPKGYFDVTDKASLDLKQTKDSLREYVDLFDEFDDRVEALEPPDEVADLVQAVLDADRELNAINHDRLDQLEVASTQAEIDAIFADDPDFSGAVQRTLDLCWDMEERAKEYSVEFDLPCEG